MVRDICNAEVDADGLEFDANSVVVTRIAEEAEYDGVRATFSGRMGNARLAMQIDIGFGDRVTPEPVEIEYPSVLGTPRAKLMGYTPETTIAEKLHIMLQRGTLNSRMKDFFDIWALSRLRAFKGTTLLRAVRAMCEQRSTAVSASPPALEPDALEDPQKAVQWAAFRRRLGVNEAPDDYLPGAVLVWRGREVEWIRNDEAASAETIALLLCIAPRMHKGHGARSEVDG